MIKFAYLTTLIVSLACMAVLDRKYALAFWNDARSTTMVIAIGVVVFIIWDILGISLGIFFSGQSAYMSGLYLAPEFPVEELFFLTFLCYFTLVTYRLAEELWQRI